MGNEARMTVKAPMYMYATEMVSSYYEKLSLRGKDVLTISGSGDQVINALYYGAKSVVGFDINRNSLFITELKLAAIQTFSYKEFLSFFIQSKSGFAHARYSKLRKSLSPACRKYFDGLYTDVGPKGIAVSEYFRDRGKIVGGKIQEINAYLRNEDSYKKIREITAKRRPELYVESVLTLTQNAHFKKRKFDIINLSNVPNYLTGKSFGLTQDDVLKYLRGLKTLLRKNGSVFFYSYDSSIYNSQLFNNTVATTEPPISKLPFLRKLKLTDYRVSRRFFPALNGDTDRITLLTK